MNRTENFLGGIIKKKLITAVVILAILAVGANFITIPVETAIENGHPFIADRFKSDSGIGHSTVVYGYFERGSTLYLLIRDSRNNGNTPAADACMAYSALKQSGGYSWTHTIYYKA